MSKLTSRSFWLTCGIVGLSGWFTYAHIMTGAQWVTLASLVLGFWQAKDALQKRRES